MALKKDKVIVGVPTMGAFGGLFNEQMLIDIIAPLIIQRTEGMINERVTEMTSSIPKQTFILKDKVTKDLGQVILHKEYETVLKLVNGNVPIILVGEAGTGKNHTAEQVAEALDLEFYFTGSVTQEYKITGFTDANGTFHETQFYKAFKNGGLFFFDEIDASTPEALIIMNAALANGYFDFPAPIGRVFAHENFRVIAGANTVGKGADVVYTGRNRLDGASLDRFSIIEFGYDEAIENAIVGDKRHIADFGRKLREVVKENGVQQIVSPRAMKHACVMEAEKFKWKRILKMTFFKGLSRDDIIMLIKALLSKFEADLNPSIVTGLKALKREL